MRRREFGQGLLGIVGLTGVGSVRGDLSTRNTVWSQTTPDSEHIEQMLFASSGGLVDADDQPLTDDSLVAIWAESTAEINDRDDNGDAIEYPDDVDIPLVAIDDSGTGTIAGVGGMLVDDGNLVPELVGDDPLGDVGNEEFLLNLYDEYTDGETILWDEGHGQFYDLGSFLNFEAYAEDNGYTLTATSDLESDLDGAAAIVITSPSDALSESELTALSDFVDDGGLVVMHNQSDFSDFDETGNLNDITDAIGAGFRFNDCEVGDEVNNVGIYYLPLTSNFNDAEFDLFADREGITVDLQAGVEYDVTVDSVADGDTVDVVFDGEDIGLATDYTGTVRVLGIDTPESEGVAQTAERPEEWEGLAYDLTASSGPVEELVFDSTASLLDENGEVLTDDSLTVVSAEPTASNEDADGNGDAVTYPDDVDIPLVAIDGAVAGLGALFVDDGFDTSADNEEFLLNLYDELVGGGTVLWDEAHGQFYDLGSFSEFEAYAEGEGYDLEATTSVEDDLAGADALVVTSPADSFSDSELTAISDFVDDGGAVILHTQSDFDDFDETDNMNEIATALGVGFRFNDDQVVDNDNNGGEFFIPATGNFDSSSPLFDERGGIGDGEQPRTTDHLVEWASKATEFADDLDGEEVTLFFDESEPLRDPTRLLAYIRYDDNGDGQRDTLYNKKVIEEGYARVYGSSMSRHDEFWEAEWEARQEGLGVWSESDISDASSYRDGSLDEVFTPLPASIRTESGSDVERYGTLYAGPDATQTDTDSPYDGQIPLFGQDGENRVAVGGSLIVDESNEPLEGFETDTTNYDNFAFLSTAIDAMTEAGGMVFVDGGHGQFGVEYALSSDDMAYYQRHLEGRGINLEQINDVTLDRLSMAHALIITTPVTSFTSEELDAISSFRDEGGAVVLLGSASAPADAIDNLNQVASELGTDLRVNTDKVTDESSNVAGYSNVPTTSALSLLTLYTDANGRVTTERLHNAVEDWRRGTIDTGLLRDVVHTWRS